MWYQQGSKTELRLDRPVFAKNIDGNEECLYLLIPQKRLDGGIQYETVGYDWFNVATGEYNSAVCWPTAEEAIKAYSVYQIFNADILGTTEDHAT